MKVKEDIPLALHTTFHIGGPARYFIEAEDAGVVREAIEFARDKNLELFVIGAGSNLLAHDEGVNAVVLKIGMTSVAREGMRLVADAGTPWDNIVDAAARHELFGVENLSGIPGTVGGAVVQNIGAYGAELAPVVEYVEAINSETFEQVRFSRGEIRFGYRTSMFKERREWIITRVSIALAERGELNFSYPDLAKMREAGTTFLTPSDVAIAVRAIRASKFPQTGDVGTAGSFFKNPVVSKEKAEKLAADFSGLPIFQQEDGTFKVSLAWLLDHALALNGLRVGGARLYERQPLVIVTDRGALSSDVESLAREVAERVSAATGIQIEREVETFGDIEK